MSKANIRWASTCKAIGQKKDLHYQELNNTSSSKGQVMLRQSILQFLYIALVLFFSQTTFAKTLDLSEYDLCKIQGDSSECTIACQDIANGRGSCIFNKCYCTEKAEIGRCEDDDHESCDALCQDISSELIGFCMDSQCSCII
ncbi:hypothetical protein BY458DRAFT_488114 [Sporodiniella umbellata]|nr:hypothetical protein BY458DRAFT_488114 [Sporodiniella umbellata]